MTTSIYSRSAIKTHLEMVHELAACANVPGKLVLMGIIPGQKGPLIHHMAIGDVPAAWTSSKITTKSR